MGQQESPCCNNFLLVIPSYNSKVIPVSALQAEKIPEAVLLYVFIIAFPAPLFTLLLTPLKKKKTELTFKWVPKSFFVVAVFLNSYKQVFL